MTGEHSQQQARRAQPTAGEKSTANSRREEHRQQQARRAHPTAGKNQKQKEQCQLQAETYEENNVSKKEVEPMTRNKDTESHGRMAAEQELKVAEKAGEH